MPRLGLEGREGILQARDPSSGGNMGLPIAAWLGWRIAGNIC